MEKVNKEKCITELYQIFGIYVVDYSIRQRSCCCCVSITEIKELLSTPLVKLNVNELEHFSRSAISTFGNVADFKHFLPRILELIAVNHNLISDFLTFEKLNYGQWKNWPKNEVLTIEKFFITIWKRVLKTNQKQVKVELYFELSCAYLGVEKTIEIWIKNWSLESVYFLADLIRFNFNFTFKKKDKIKIENRIYQHDILALLETIFMREKNEEMINTLSIAHFILEQKIKSNNNF